MSFNVESLNCFFRELVHILQIDELKQTLTALVYIDEVQVLSFLTKIQLQVFNFCLPIGPANWVISGLRKCEIGSNNRNIVA